MLTRREVLLMAGGLLMLPLVGCRKETELEFIRRNSEDYRKAPLEKGVPTVVDGTIIQNDNNDLDLYFIENSFEALYGDLGGLSRPINLRYVDQTDEDPYGPASVVYRDGTMHINISTAIIFNNTDTFYRLVGMGKPDFLTALSYNISGTTASRLYLASKSAVTDAGIISDTEAARSFSDSYLRSVVDGHRSLLIVVNDYRRIAESVR